MWYSYCRDERVAGVQRFPGSEKNVNELKLGRKTELFEIIHPCNIATFSMVVHKLHLLGEVVVPAVFKSFVLKKAKKSSQGRTFHGC